MTQVAPRPCFAQRIRAEGGNYFLFITLHCITLPRRQSLKSFSGSSRRNRCRDLMSTLLHHLRLSTPNGPVVVVKRSSPSGYRQKVHLFCLRPYGCVGVCDMLLTPKANPLS
jgi:hypothetical protein